MYIIINPEEGVLAHPKWMNIIESGKERAKQFTSYNEACEVLRQMELEGYEGYTIEEYTIKER